MRAPTLLSWFLAAMLASHAMATAIPEPALAGGAADAAVQTLIDQVLELRLSSRRTLSAELASAPAAERSLREAIVMQRELGAASTAPDGSVTAEASLSKAGLIAMLEEVRREHLPKLDRARLTLSAAVPARLGATGTLSDSGVARDARPGWRHCSRDDVLLAARAAESDLRQHIVRKLGELRLVGQPGVGELFTRHLLFQEAVHRNVQELPAGEPAFTSAGLCIRTMRLTRTEISALLARAAEECPEKIDADLSRLSDAGLEDPMTVYGFAVTPREQPVARATARPVRASRSGPPWLDQVITSSGSGRAPEGSADQADRRRTALLVARTMAARGLWAQIEALPLPEGETVGVRLAREEAIGAMESIESAMLTTGAATFDDKDTATITISIRLSIVWEALSGQER